MAKQPKPSGDKPTRRTQGLPQRTSGTNKRPTPAGKPASGGKSSPAAKTTRQSGAGASGKQATPPTGKLGGATKRAGTSGRGAETQGKRGSSGDSRRQTRDYNVRMSGMPLNIRFMLWISGMSVSIVLIFFLIVYSIAIAALDREIERSGAYQSENVASLGRVFAEYLQNPHFVEVFLRDTATAAQLDDFYDWVKEDLRLHAMRVGKPDYWENVRDDGASVADSLRDFYDPLPSLYARSPQHDSIEAFRHDLILAFIDIFDLSTVHDPDSYWQIEEGRDVAGIKFRYQPEQNLSLVAAFEAYLLHGQRAEAGTERPVPEQQPRALRNAVNNSISEDKRSRFWEARSLIIRLLYNDNPARGAEPRLRQELRGIFVSHFKETYIEPIVATDSIVGAHFAPGRGAETLVSFSLGQQDPEIQHGTRIQGFEGVTLLETSSADYGQLLQFNTEVSVGNDNYWAFVQLDRDHVMSSRNQLVISLLVIAVIAVVIGICVSYFLASNVTKPINTLVEDVIVIARGDYRHRTRVRARDEIGVLARTIDLMTEGLQEAQVIARKAGEMEHDLSIAEEVVIHLLPESLPKIYGYDVYAFFNPSKDVGGDYYDFFEIDDEHVGMIVADVAGKGIPGALVMTMARTVIRMEATQTTSPRDTFVNSNRLIAQDIKRGMFVTAFYLVLNTQTGEMKAASAGHNPMIIWRAATGKCECVNPNGIALGFDKGPIFERTIKEETIQLYSGDRVVNYTDGVVEAMSPDGEEFEEERLIEIIESYPDANSNQLTNIIVQAVLDHQGRGEQHDDITIVTFKLH